MSNSNKFVFFGCWNNVNENSNLKNTMSTLTNYLTSNPEIPFVVVGGDNFYPDKSKKKEQKHVNHLFTSRLKRENLSQEF